MVVDTMENIGKYVSLNPLFEEMVKFINTHDLATLEVGKHPIVGNDLFVNIAVANGKTEEEAVFETHRKMIDVQIPLDAPETYGYTPLCDLPEVEYNEEKDITKYAILADTYVTCKPGEFAIFFPQDGHAPCISDKAQIKKAIFKVLA